MKRRLCRLSMVGGQERTCRERCEWWLPGRQLCILTYAIAVLAGLTSEENVTARILSELRSRE